MAFVIQKPQAKSLGELLGGGISTGIQQKLAQLAAPKGAEEFSEEELVQRGFTPEEANFFKALTTGGKTALAQTAIERMQREKGLAEGPQFTEQQQQGQPQTAEQQQKAEIQQEIAGADLGLTPKEKVSRQESRFKVNTDLFNKTEKSLRKFDETGLKIEQLKRLNEKGTLPKGLGRLNINFKTGELVFPAGASPDSQLFVKTINDFLSAAKDTFGARVTNFEVERFLKRLPSLANTEDGRTLILKQMDVLNKINQLQESGVINAFEKAGGIRNLDFDSATRIGRKQNLDEINNLRREFAQIADATENLPAERSTEEGAKREEIIGQEFNKLPKAAAFKGAIIEDDKGNRFISTGTKWRKVNDF